MYTLKRGTEITADALKKVIAYNTELKPRFNKLEKYYFGKHTILDRTRTDQDINNKLVVNHAKYITDINNGYLLGSPVDYQADDDNLNIEDVVKSMKKNHVSDLDSDIAKDISIYGVQHEYIYANEENEPRSANLDNRQTVLVYDNTLDHKKLFGITYTAFYDGRHTENTKVKYWEITYCDKEVVIEYKLVNSNAPTLIELEASKLHGFGGVPMIEYKNNSDKMGDFESVLTLIDAYNILQSDRLNDKEQLVDAILAVYGADVTKIDMELLRENRVLSGIPEKAKVEYLTKQINEKDADTLRQTIEADIHKISMTPNMSDEKFVGNSSGVAIRYKLLAFEMNTKTKERHMERGLMERFELYWTYLKSISKAKGKIEMDKIKAVFTRSLPSNDLETAEVVTKLDGKVSDETLVSQLSFVKDASIEVKKVRGEALERAKALTKAFQETEIKDGNEDGDER
jgi:SPP1 family phage portal protein